MIATGHIAAGFIASNFILTKINDPFLAGTLVISTNIALHYVTDVIPHGHLLSWDEVKEHKKDGLIYLDVLGGVTLFSIITLGIFGVSLQTVLLGLAILGSLLPDIIGGFFYYPPKRPPTKFPFSWEYRFHILITHWHGPGEEALPLKWYDIWQAIVIGVAIMTPFLIKG